MIQGKQKKGGKVLFGIAAALAVAGFTATADAAVTGVTAVNVVEYGQGFLLVQLIGGVNYVGRVSAPNCVSLQVSADTLKGWLSMSQAAFLSGRRLKIHYTLCSSENHITAMDIWQ